MPLTALDMQGIRDNSGREAPDDIHGTISRPAYEYHRVFYLCLCFLSEYAPISHSNNQTPASNHIVAIVYYAADYSVLAAKLAALRSHTTGNDDLEELLAGNPTLGEIYQAIAGDAMPTGSSEGVHLSDGEIGHVHAASVVTTINTASTSVAIDSTTTLGVIPTTTSFAKEQTKAVVCQSRHALNALMIMPYESYVSGNTKVGNYLKLQKSRGHLKVVACVDRGRLRRMADIKRDIREAIQIPVDDLTPEKLLRHAKQYAIEQVEHPADPVTAAVWSAIDASPATKDRHERWQEAAAIIVTHANAIEEVTGPISHLPCIFDSETVTIT